MDPMAMCSVSGLGELREKILGFNLGGASRLSRIDAKRLYELEQDNSSITVWESEALGRLYGIDGDVLAESPIELSSEDAVSVLASADEFRPIGDTTRAAVMRAASAARDLVKLSSLLELEVPPVAHQYVRYERRSDDHPYKEGAAAAMQVRARYGLQNGPILSMRDWVRDTLRGVTLLYANLGTNGPAGLTFAGQSFGPAIVLNLEGKNENPCVRRFSLAHEVCHLLVDWNHRDPLATLSGYLDETHLAREQKANSFAIRFLCPEGALPLQLEINDDEVRTLMIKWGLHYAAVRLYIRNTRSVELPRLSNPALDVTGAEWEWEAREEPHGIAAFPVRACPPERRTRVAQLAGQAYSRGLIQRDHFAEFLGLRPTHDLERVLDFLGYDPPAPAETQAA